MADVVVLTVSFVTGISVLALLSLGLAVVFTTRGIINLAHGEFVMMGAFTTVTLTRSGVPFVIALLVAAALLAVFGWVLEVTLVRRLDGRPTDCMLATWGVSLIVTQVAVLLFGTTSEGLSIPLGSIQVGAAYTVGVYNLVLIAAAVVSIVVLALVLRRTRTGLFIRAAAQSEIDARTLGVDTRRVRTIAFTSAAAFTGFAGGLLAPFLGVSPTMGATFIAKAFMTVMVGGANAVVGTAAASFALGGTDNILSTWQSPLVGTLALLLIAVVIVRFMPRGLTGGRR
ncbi:branched-chain amino acid ABC transporter permease [Pseudonocardia sp. GCM10023141]|uniref:branched-chain amino acid ABC transporter permease n=1 Tax=Pseudonocardia sp. GCM10023141 TaxID=3252653 RepID=UPI003613F211